MDDRELFETYREQVYRLCYVMMQNASDAEDICQEVFVKAILADRSQIREIKPWLLRIASNECNSLLKRRRSGWGKELRNYLLSRTHTSSSIEEHVDQRMIREELYSLCSRLPSKIRMVVTLRYVNEMTVPEISDVINIPEGTVKSRLNRGLKLLRQLAAPQVKEMVSHE